MSQTSGFDPARLVLSLPTCPKCGATMWLARIEPDKPQHDKRTYECPKCEHEVSDVVKYR
jgi:ribosomal protein S27AE